MKGQVKKEPNEAVTGTKSRSNREVTEKRRSVKKATSTGAVYTGLGPKSPWCEYR